MQGPPRMYYLLADEFISLVEKYEEENVQEDEEVENTFCAWHPDQIKMEGILFSFIEEYGLSHYMDSKILDVLPTVLVSRTVSYWTFRTIARFCDELDGITFPAGYFGDSLYNECQDLMNKKVKLQLCVKRFLARKKLAELKNDDICAICVEPIFLGRHTTPCGHLFHTNCIRRWKAIKPECPMCRAGL